MEQTRTKYVQSVPRKSSEKNHKEIHISNECIAFLQWREQNDSFLDYWVHQTGVLHAVEKSIFTFWEKLYLFTKMWMKEESIHSYFLTLHFHRFIFVAEKCKNRNSVHLYSSIPRVVVFIWLCHLNWFVFFTRMCCPYYSLKVKLFNKMLRKFCSQDAKM